MPPHTIIAPGEPGTAAFNRPARFHAGDDGVDWALGWVNRIELVGDSAEATSQMREYAHRTHQRGQPRLARDYSPATIDTAAMPLRVERWIRDGGQTATPASTTTCSLWSHWWTPDAPGRSGIVLKVDEPSIRTRRLDLFFYARSVEIGSI